MTSRIKTVVNLAEMFESSRFDQPDAFRSDRNPARNFLWWQLFINEHPEHKLLSRF